MSTVLAVMDRPGWQANTDVLVVADPGRRRLLWVPRDLWSVRYARRVNGVYALGGHRALLKALRGLGVRVKHSLCVQREASELTLSRVQVQVPVAAPLEYWYPLTPQERIEDGKKLVRFGPPHEVLEGERIHQWVGARSSPHWYGGDMDRIRRQQAFTRAFLQAGHDPGRVVRERPELIRASSGQALAELGMVRADWELACLASTVPVRIGDCEVLLRHRLRGRLGRAELRWRAARAGAELG